MADIIRDPHVAINVLSAMSLFAFVIIHQGHERKEIKFVFIQRLRIEITNSTREFYHNLTHRRF